MYDQDWFIVDYIYIKPKYRKRGYVKQVLTKLKQKHKKIKTTTISKSNTASRKLFESAGFKIKPSDKQLVAIYRK